MTVKGTTGARTEYDEGVAGYLQELQSLSSAPVLAGFGVSTPAQVNQLGQYCDGVIVGSKIVELLALGKRDEIVQLIQASKFSSGLSKVGK